MKIKTSEATGLQLDWGLGLAMELSPIVHKALYVRPATSVHALTGNHQGSQYYKEFGHTEPAVCMGLIEQYKVAVRFYAVEGFWVATIYNHDPQDWISKTLPQAIARCVIAIRLGDEFECPDELCQIECWSCGHTMTLEQRSTNDGHCIKCNAEIELGVMS